ncbi:agamous-like MADS-box protein AGL11 [Quercus suber]|uniref:agamous-like MADS-box protein AGL11 n=1 Tax=Quercus suber TaxID=58331 RepID=UPI0032DF3A6E
MGVKRLIYPSFLTEVGYGTLTVRTSGGQSVKIGTTCRHIELEANHSTKSTIERYKKACNDGSGTSSIAQTNAQYYQQESTKLRQLIQNMQNANRHLLGEGLSSLSIKEMKQLESRIEQGLTRIRSKKVMELENESVYLQAKIAEVERLQQVNLNMSGSELNAIQALSCNFFTPILVEGSTSFAQPK